MWLHPVNWPHPPAWSARKLDPLLYSLTKCRAWKRLFIQPRSRRPAGVSRRKGYKNPGQTSIPSLVLHRDRHMGQQNFAMALATAGPTTPKWHAQATLPPQPPIGPCSVVPDDIAKGQNSCSSRSERCGLQWTRGLAWSSRPADRLTEERSHALSLRAFLLRNHHALCRVPWTGDTETSACFSRIAPSPHVVVADDLGI